MESKRFTNSNKAARLGTSEHVYAFTLRNPRFRTKFTQKYHDCIL
jgi:hypothetical protein